MKRSGFKRAAPPERKPVPPYTLTREIAQAFVIVRGNVQQKDTTPRDRKLLDLAHRVTTCQNCDRHSAHGCEPAHANWSALGKGMSRKAFDWAHAALCHYCHTWLDQGGGTDPSGHYAGDSIGKREMWTRAHFRTFSHYWREGWIRTS